MPVKPTLQDVDYTRVASLLGVSVPAIKAVADVESSGQGFLASGEPKILFEAHVFDRLTGGRYRRSHPQISSKSWNKALYGAGGANQHKRLQLAVSLDRDAGLQSASWGKFQIMGFNWRRTGRASLQAFISAQYISEAEHLKDFAGIVKSFGLVDELQRLDWSGFASGYNGPGYAANRYDTKMAAAYKRHGGTS